MIAGATVCCSAGDPKVVLRARQVRIVATSYNHKYYQLEVVIEALMLCIINNIYERAHTLSVVDVTFN